MAILGYPWPMTSRIAKDDEIRRIEPNVMPAAFGHDLLAGTRQSRFGK
jgi:hypothetical protein